MFRIKICGITNVEDAQGAVNAGVDAVGLNFYRGSPRYVTSKRAKAIVDALPDEVTKVGLFVGASATEVCETFEEFGLDMIQIHGEETPEYLARLGKRPLIRAFRIGQQQLYPVDDYLRRCGSLGCMPKMALFDALVPGVYGGTGTLADWKVLRDYPLHPSHPPLVLAGGLTPQNVGDAIEIVGPSAVDVASGVESSPGKKNSAAMASFVKAAKLAFEELA